MTNAAKVVEQFAGVLLVLYVLADVFLTVLYARMRTGILSTYLAHAVWSMFRAAARRMHSYGPRLLFFCGPVILVTILLVWALGLTLGSALIIHPHLGTSIRASSGQTEGDFITALFAAGSSIAVVGASNYDPQSTWSKLFYLFNSLIGMSVLSLTLTYLMQIYTALQRRNSVALGVDVSTGRKGDAAELIAGLGPQGRFETGYTNLSELAESVSALKEAHHFYPVLFYFRFEEPFYSVSRLSNVALDAITIIRAALDKDKYRWFLESGAVSETWDAALLLVTTLEEAFLPDASRKSEPPDSQTAEQWRARFFCAVKTLQAANIGVVGNLDSAASSYVALRSKWSGHIRNLAPAMLFSPEDVDPATARQWPTRDSRRAA
jgi:hypothetical protein